MVARTSDEKWEIGNRIVRALGGDPTPKVTGYDSKPGRADGGIDGRIPILIERRIIIEKNKKRADGKNITFPIETGELEWVEAEAGFNIKIKKKCLEREKLNAFVEDLKREGIYAGVIVTANGLCPSAESEFKRHNDKEMDLCHIYLEDLLSGNISCPEIRFVVGDLAAKLRVSLRGYLTP